MKALFLGAIILFFPFSNVEASNNNSKTKFIQNCEILENKKSGKPNSILLECKSPISTTKVNKPNKIPIELKKIEERLNNHANEIENNLKKQNDKKNEELATWRKQANVNSFLSYLIGGVSR